MITITNGAKVTSDRAAAPAFEETLPFVVPEVSGKAEFLHHVHGLQSMSAMRTEVSQFPEEEFELRFRTLLFQDARVLDAGCAAGKFSTKRETDADHFSVAGIDVLESVKQNACVDFRICGNVNQLPFADDSFDVIYARWLVEHLEYPSLAFREFHRVLKPGGRLALFTTNLLHYYGAAAKLTPHWFHLWFNREVRGFSEDTICPTYYRANTRRRLHELLLNAGFNRSGFEITAAEGAPNALAFNSVLHRFGMCYAYLVRRFESLSSFRMNLTAIACKENSPEQGSPTG
jgi:ubiquinone/menaquinone biosynthesis C-methylase UbiE